MLDKNKIEIFFLSLWSRNTDLFHGTDIDIAETSHNQIYWLATKDNRPVRVTLLFSLFLLFFSSFFSVFFFSFFVSLFFLSLFFLLQIFGRAKARLSEMVRRPCIGALCEEEESFPVVLWIGEVHKSGSLKLPIVMIIIILKISSARRLQ